MAIVLAPAVGCRQDMHDQPVLEAYEVSDFFADGRADREPIVGTVARGQLREDPAYYTGVVGDSFVAEIPIIVSKALLQRGRQRYDIFCSPCHDRAGNGQGMIVRRGFKQPASFHEARLRDQPVGYFFDVMSRGFGEMSSYAPLVSHEDRWAIAAYIRALQYSRNVPLRELDPADRARIEAALPADDGSSEHAPEPETGESFHG